MDSTVNGIEYKYYEESWVVMPDFEALTPVKAGRVYEFGLHEINKRGNNFGIRFSSYIEIPEEGKYIFYTRSDDGSNLYIGEELIVNNDGTHGLKEANGSINLKAGRYPIIVDFFESGGGEELEVLYKGPDSPKHPIPASSLFKLPD